MLIARREQRSRVLDDDDDVFDDLPTTLSTAHYLVGSSDECWTRTFVTRYLRNDGFVILKLIAANCSETTTAEIICALSRVCKANNDNRMVV